MSPQFKLLILMAGSFIFLVCCSLTMLDAMAGKATILDEVKTVVTDNKILTALLLSEILAFVPAKAKGLLHGGSLLIKKFIPYFKKRAIK